MGTRKTTEYIIDIILLFMGVGFWASSQSIAHGSAIGLGGEFMPKVTSALWILTSIGLLINEYTTPDDKVKGITANVKGFVATFVLLFAYIFTLDILGFIISSILYMFIQMYIFVPDALRSKRNYILFAIVSIVTPIIVNEVFVEVFSLILPTGLL